MIVPRIALLCALSASAFGQTPTATVEIQFAGHAAGFWGRYVVSNGRGRSAGWTNPQNGTSYRVEGIFAGPTTRIKGIFYAPGCALQTLDIPVQEARLYPYSFPCEAVGQTAIQGVATGLDPSVRGHNERIEAKYVALWAPAFLSYDDGTTTEIPLKGMATVDEQGGFRLPVPDFTKDKIASSPNHAAEIRIWLRDPDTPRIVAKLRLISGEPKMIQPSRFGGVPIDSIGESLLEFATCYANPPAMRDEFGFNIRGAGESDCVP